MCIGASQQILRRIRPAVAGTLAVPLFDQPAHADQLIKVLSNHSWVFITLRLQINIAYLTSPHLVILGEGRESTGASRCTASGKVSLNIGG